MTPSERRAAAVALIAGWAIALAPGQWLGRSLAAFVVVFLAPGFLLDRQIGAGEKTSRAEAPARALAFSIALIGLFAAACTAFGLSIRVLDAALAAVSFALVLAPSRARTRASQIAGTAPVTGQPPTAVAPASRRVANAALAATPMSSSIETRAAVAALVALTLAAAALAALDVNLARDRMWYGAYVTQLAGAGALDWHEPMLATGNIAWRFAHNAWLAALAAWCSVANVGAVALLERLAPPLLVLLLPSSAFGVARALVSDRGRAAILAACSIIVLLASAYPYFSPERYAFFARIVEDKTAALVLLCPVALSIGIDVLETPRLRARDAVRFVLALTATALTHAIVFFIAGLSLAVYAAARLVARRCTLRSATAALALCAAAAVAPAILGLRARSTILGVERGAAASSAIAARTDPVVRAHLRMERLRELPAGGPIVAPRLLADPLLALALLGFVPALAARRSAFGSFTCASTLTFLALGFVPFLAPAFGRLVVPWMAYRALWGVPFGLLLGALVLALDDTARRYSPAVARRLTATVLVALATLAAAELPWPRAFAGNDSAKRTAMTADTRTLLRAIAALPADAMIAAAPGLAELVPAYTGHPVLAFSDRGTVALAGSRDLAERRLIANAAIVGLHGTSAGMRKALIARYAVSHVVYEAAPCDLGMRAVHSAGRFVICAAPQPARTAVRRRHTALRRGMQLEHLRRREPAIDRVLRPTGPIAGARVSALASLHDGIDCEPAPQRTKAAFRWQRRERWSAAFTEVTCRVRFSPPRSVRAIRVRAHLPHAREAFIVHASAEGPNGACATRTGAVELGGESASTIHLRCPSASAVTIRLVPSFLPYLSLRELEVIGNEPAATGRARAR